MGYIRRPAYYKAFRCIGSDCTENCCIGWEIDVDEDSLAYYETVPGDFGERLRASIAPADEQTGEPAHFRLDAEERCPLLNDCNLCEVLLHLGEDKMAQICTDHPRYYEWFSDGREDGLGLCCEAAAELILAQTGAPAFDVTEADGVSETGTEAETELENVLFSMRDALFRLACEDAPFDDKADRLYRTRQRRSRSSTTTCCSRSPRTRMQTRRTRTRFRGRRRSGGRARSRACSRCCSALRSTRTTGARC